MLRFARLLLVLAVAFGSVAAAALNGRVLCLNGPGHVAVEAAHRGTGCPAGHGPHVDDRELPSDGHDTPGTCVDLAPDVDLVRESAAAQLDLQHAQAFLPPMFAEPLRLVSVPTTGVAARFDSRQHPPAPGELARLRDIILTI